MKRKPEDLGEERVLAIRVAAYPPLLIPSQNRQNKELNLNIKNQNTFGLVSYPTFAIKPRSQAIENPSSNDSLSVPTVSSNYSTVPGLSGYEYGAHRWADLRLVKKGNCEISVASYPLYIGVSINQ